MPEITLQLDADIGERERIAEWLGEHQPTHIVHLAALSHVVGPPLPFFEVNVLGTEALIEAAAETLPDLVKLVVASSANVYGNAATLPIDEDTPVLPVNHYALSKAAAEFVARKWFDRLPIIVTRPFNYTGPGQSERFVYAKLAASFRRRDSIIRLGNTGVARDLTDVEVVCEAYARLLDTSAKGLTVNICSGKSVSLAEAITCLRELTGHEPVLEVDPSLIRESEIQDLRGDPTRLGNLIGALPAPSLRQTFARMLAQH